MTRAFSPVSLLAFLALFSVFSLGCSGDEYFCDDTGCYFCDGVGCREAEAPERNACNGDFQCGEAKCSSIGCVDACSADSDCPKGTVCKTGLCLNPTEDMPTLTPGMTPVDLDACKTDEECRNQAVCHEGFCRSPCDESAGEQASFIECQRYDASLIACIDNFCRIKEEL